MKLYMISIVALLSSAAAVAVPDAAPQAASTSAYGTWTFYSTVLKTVSIATLTTPIVCTEFPLVTTSTDSRTFTTTTNSYASTETVVATATRTSTYATVTTTAYIFPGSTVSSPTPPGHTPILSEFAYIASVLVTTVKTTTVTVGGATVCSSTTSSPYYVNGQPTTSTVTVSKSGVLTTSSTSTIYNYVVATSTALQLKAPTATRYAACDVNSGNYVDHFPFGYNFGPIYPDFPGQNTIGTVYSVDPQGPYYNLTYQGSRNKVDCCNLAMSQSLSAFGYWMPYDIYGPVYGGRNACYIFTVKDQQSCQPSEVRYTLPKAHTNETGGFYAFNARCGRVTPDHHERAYYSEGGQYTPENSP